MAEAQKANMNIDTEEMKRALAMADRNYLPLCMYLLTDDEKQIYLGNKMEKKCRFCGRTKADGVTFKKKAHALSNLIGNRTLLSYYECDECNQKFAHYETDFAEYLRPFHALLKVRGKNGIPKYKQYLSEIDGNGDILNVNVFEEDPTIRFSINQEQKHITIECRRSYVPIKVYKALLKMALTILPDADISHFSSALKFLGSETATCKTIMPVAIQLYGGGGNVFKHIMAAIFKRKEDAPDNVFAYMFILAYNNFCFQMPLRGCDLDNYLDGKLVQMPIIPTPPLFEGYPIIKLWKADLSSSTKVSNELVSISMQFSEMQEEDLTKIPSMNQDAIDSQD